MEEALSSNPDISSSLSKREIIYRHLHRASSCKDVSKARGIYSLMILYGLHTLSSLADRVIRLFALSGCLEEVNTIFAHVSNPSVYTWNSIISAHIEFSQPEEAMCLYFQMIQSGIEPDQVSFLYALKVCSEIRGFFHVGRIIHYHIMRYGLDPNVLVGSTLIDMYAKCGWLVEGHYVLSKLQNRNSISWGVLVSGYARHGCIDFSLYLIECMNKEGMILDKATFLCILKACGREKTIAHGMLIHSRMVSIGFEFDHFLVNSLVDMYAKCKLMEEALYVFENASEKDVVCWVALISGYIQLKKDKYSIELFKEMQQKGVSPDRVSFLCVLKACGNLGMVIEGHIIHGCIVKYGFDINTDIQNTLIHVYSKCGFREEAYLVFDQSRNRDVVSWSAMAAGYVEEGSSSHALELFHAFQKEAIDPNTFLFSSVLTACGSLRALHQGRLIHGYIIINGHESDVVVANSLIDMYGKCGSLNDSCHVFCNLSTPDEVSYGSLIAGSVQNEQEDLVLDLFQKMQMQSIKPNQAIFALMLKAYGIVGSFEQGGFIYAQIIENGFECDAVVVSSLIDMYVKCGSLEDARSVFEGMEERDVVLWGVIIAGYVESEHVSSAIQLYKEMREEGIMPSNTIFISILKACSIIRTIDQGRHIHQDIARLGVVSDSWAGYVDNALLDMYAKCGSFEDAHKVFEDVPNQDVVSWGTITMAYANSGNWKMAQNCLKNMSKLDLTPDATIFANILIACSHAGVLDVGLEFFRLIASYDSLEPTLLHYSLLIDLTARTGHLALALELIETMPYLPESFLWTSILTECVLYGDIQLACDCFDEAFQLDPNDASGYALILNALTDGHSMMMNDSKDNGKATNILTGREYGDDVVPLSLAKHIIYESNDHKLDGSKYTGVTYMNSFCNIKQITIITLLSIFSLVVSDFPFHGHRKRSRLKILTCHYEPIIMTMDLI